MRLRTPMITPLKQARGLGASHGGLEHFWRQRVTALANVPLTVFVIICFIMLSGSGHETIAGFFRNPFAALLVLLFVISSMWHMLLGMQVIIEDYVQHSGLKVMALLGNILFTAFFGITSVYAILKLSLGG